MADVKIFEVGPRDGLQNEGEFVDTNIKITLIDMLSESGLKHIEATSFVSPKWVPQMADAKEVMAGIKRNENITYSALTPNERGMISAIESGVSEIAIFAAASESFSQKNINCSIDESLVRFAPVLKLANDKKMPVRGYISCATHCPYEGEIGVQNVTMLANKLLNMGCYEISLGDTIGKAKPSDIRNLISEISRQINLSHLALHLHDTYGRALKNIKAGLDMGIRTFDSSIGGLGGCPYAEGASGNVATEKVVELLESQGFNTGIDAHKLSKITHFIQEKILNLNK